VQHLLRDQRHTLSAVDFERVAALTDGYSGSDLATLCREAALAPIRQLLQQGCALETLAADEIRPISVTDLIECMQQIRPSCSQALLEELEQWRVKFGSLQ